jgi:hypothetical protein
MAPKTLGHAVWQSRRLKINHAQIRTIFPDDAAAGLVERNFKVLARSAALN